MSSLNRAIKYVRLLNFMHSMFACHKYYYSFLKNSHVLVLY